MHIELLSVSLLNKKKGGGNKNQWVWNKETFKKTMYEEKETMLTGNLKTNK